MAIPRSFEVAGYILPANRQRRLLITTEGKANTGKSEFLFSAPGPGVIIAVDRNIDPLFDNPNPPTARQENFGIKEVQLPTATDLGSAAVYMEHWKTYYKQLMEALAMPEVKTVCVDGDSDTWELQRLASFGKLTQIPSIMYTDVNAARRAIINKMYDAKKIIIVTNKVKEEYIDKKDADGNPVLSDSGKPIRVKSGTYYAQGFDDKDYYWHIALEHMYKDGTTTEIKIGPLKGKTKKTPGEFGIKILRCKPNKVLEGDILWGDQCNFQGLVQHVYPQISLEVWGY